RRAICAWRVCMIDIVDGSRWCRLMPTRFAVRAGRCAGSNNMRSGAVIWAGIAACSRDREPVEIIGPAPRVSRALRFVGKTAMGHPQQGATVAVDKIDLDQARAGRHFLAALPAEAVGQAVNRDDLPKGAPRRVALADALDEVEPARLRLGRRLRAHP